MSSDISVNRGVDKESPCRMGMAHFVTAQVSRLLAPVHRGYMIWGSASH